MSDQRAVAWSHLLPADVRYVVKGGPEWWREELRTITVPDGAPVSVVWGSAPPHTWFTPESVAIVLVNPNAETLNQLRALTPAHIRRFAVLPRLSDARWFVPLGSRRLTEAALKLYTPYRWKARAAHAGLRIATRIGVPPWRQDVIAIASHKPSLAEQLLRDTLGADPAALAISTGTPGPARKPTLAAIHRTGRIWAVCKLATSSLAHRLIANEAACLNTLARRTELTFCYPRLLADRQLESGRAIVVEGVQGQRAGTRLTVTHLRLLSRLASGPLQPATASTLFTGLPARIHALQVSDAPAHQLLEWAGRILNGLLLPQTIVHGDFAPWNLKVCDDEIVAFDWEYGQCDGLPLLDEIHHVVQVGLLVHKWSVGSLLAELRRQAASGRFGLSREHIQALQAIYLLDTYLRRKEEIHPADDSLLERQKEILTRVAESIGASGA